ncbi:caspase family protein [Pseudohalioglobus lutimaris]|uniref:Peptidase C14 caspase domain-containing protein n=1 Tax=Pseudohalioglobus lutimaris TaxID=1737061 RepID=A0A2N5WZT1_9GAMM|nr:caspase family protein [Pseudohalioglobus lutimaris]PLW67751.1 hypothetical protein C0039_15130 [Pseudohalioglobus lutimaris]
MQLGAIVVGVGNYSYDDVEVGYPLEQLEFAVTDAQAIVEYLEICWGEKERVIEKVYDLEATQTEIDMAFNRLCSEGPFETFFVYFSGHGISQPDKTGFLLQPEEHSRNLLSILEADRLNSILGRCPAKQTIFVLDCCYAGAITEKLPYFIKLNEGDTARLFIASSKANQVAWEDHQIGHGIFTAHLLDLLNTGDTEAFGTRRSFLDVDGELFPILCEQVPLYALRTKAVMQEPLKGGSSANPILLPTVNATRTLESSTTLSTALHRFRQLLISMALFVAFLLVAANTLIFHIEPNESGTLAVKRGPRWLEPVFRNLPFTRAESRLSISQLSPDPSQARAVQGGYAAGVWLHRSTHGYRAWADVALDSLEADSAFQYRTLLGVRPRDDENWISGEKVASAELMLRIWSLIGSDTKPLPILLSRIPGSDRYQDINEPFQSSKFDFGVLDLNVDQMLRYASALEFSTVIDHEMTWPHFLGFAKASREWLYHTSEATRGRGAHDRVKLALSDVLVRIISERRSRELSSLSSDMLDQLLTLHERNYSDALGFAFARSQEPKLVDIARKEGLAGFQGNPSEPDQERALLKLVYSLDGSVGSKRLVDQAVAAFEAADLLPNSYHIRLLIEAGASGSMSEKQLSMLLDDADAAMAKKVRDFDDVELARVLAFSIGQFAREDRDRAFRFIEMIASEEPPMSSMVSQIYAALAEKKFDSPEMRAHIRRQVSVARTDYQNFASASENQPGMSIFVSSDPWISALASIALSRPLGLEDKELLLRHLDNPRLGNTIARALAAHSIPKDKYQSATKIREELNGLLRDHPGRDRVERLSAYAIAMLSHEKFQETMDALAVIRADEIEPQTRASIGQIIINAYLARSKPTSVGLPLAR